MHVLDRVDGDATSSDFAGTQRIIAVAPHQCWKIEGGREAGIGSLGILEQVLEPGIGVISRAESGELPHRPESSPVHARMNTPGVGKLAGLPDAFAGLVRLLLLGRLNGFGPISLREDIARECHRCRVNG